MKTSLRDLIRYPLFLLTTCLTWSFFSIPIRVNAACCLCSQSNEVQGICIQTASQSATCADLANSQNPDIKTLTCLTPAANCTAFAGGGSCLKGPFDEASFTASALNQKPPPPSAPASSHCCKCTLPDDPKRTICINTSLDCENVKTASKNADVQKLSCASTQQACKPVSQNGSCIQGPIDEAVFALSRYATATLETTGPALTPPVLNIDIPTLQFSSKIIEKNGILEVPFLAQYVAAIYRVLIGISAVACAIMIIWGGFKYIVASTGAGVKEGKSQIVDAIVGLIIVLSAYTILQTINPATLNLNPIKIQTIRQSAWESGQFRYSPSPAQQAGLGPDGPKDTPTDATRTAEIIKSAAKNAGIDPCVLLAICEHETGLKTNIWSGQMSGTAKEKAVAFGVCQIALGNILSECPPNAPCNYFSSQLRSKFSDYPPAPTGPSMTEEDKNARRDWLLKNVEGNAYIAATIFKSGGANELYKAASYGAGKASIDLWAKAHGCTPVAGMTIKQAIQNPSSALQASCIPHFVAIPTVGDPPKGCPDDKFECPNAKINSRSEFEGTCPSNPNQKCYAMLTDEFVQYLIKAYPRMVEKYQCDR